MSVPHESPPQFGQGDASFRAAGGEAGIRRLVDRFYDLMDDRPDAAAIRKMHPRDLEGSRDKLARFLCGWLGGPKLYNEKYGPIRIPKAHARFRIGAAERDAWLDCMAAALVSLPLAEDFKAYLLRELAVPADQIVVSADQIAPSVSGPQNRRSEASSRPSGEPE